MPGNPAFLMGGNYMAYKEQCDCCGKWTDNFGFIKINGKDVLLCSECIAKKDQIIIDKNDMASGKHIYTQDTLFK